MRTRLLPACLLALALLSCLSPAPARAGGQRAVSSPDAPAAIGPYSQAVLAGGLLFASGQIGLDPATGHLVDGGVEAQARRCLENLRAVARAAGLDLDRAVKVTVYLADMADFAAVNTVYAGYFSAPFPARAAVQVAALPRNARVEIEAVFAAQ